MYEVSRADFNSLFKYTIGAPGICDILLQISEASSAVGATTPRWGPEDDEEGSIQLLESECPCPLAYCLMEDKRILAN